MTTYLYCLLTAPSDAVDSVPAVPDGLTGIRSEAVRAIATGGIAAWVGTVASSMVDRNVETARRHDAVVRAALASGSTPLPARAGQIFEDDARCLEELARRANEISGVLRRVEGCVEMTVHLSLPAPALGAVLRGGARAEGSQGRAYLERIREQLQLERFVQDEAAGAQFAIARMVEGLSRAESMAVPQQAGTAFHVRISHLIDRRDIVRYRRALEGQGSHRGTITTVAGPYPPYSFARLSDD